MQETRSRLTALCDAAMSLEAAIAAQVRIIAHHQSAIRPEALQETEASLACEQAMLRYLHAEICVAAIDRVVARERGGDTWAPIRSMSHRECARPCCGHGQGRRSSA